MVSLLRTVEDLRLQLSGLRRGGGQLALVPTMGALHEGHLSLVREGARRADLCAVSIFVNPLQFGPSEDLARYPRDERGDVEKCAAAGADLIWAPPPSEVYPAGFQTAVEVPALASEWDGRLRPGHFRGVATVVTKLLSLFRPEFALFGEKDYQQLQIVRRLARDLDFEAQVVGLPTVREPDGLAMSSRNAYLTADERPRAAAIYRGLRAAQAMRAAGVTAADALLEAVRQELAAAELREEYVALVDPESLEPRPTADQPARILVAVWLGKTRLIDNVAV